jgi:tetratricopeptide (TPR) repeat protein
MGTLTRLLLMAVTVTGVVASDHIDKLIQEANTLRAKRQYAEAERLYTEALPHTTGALTATVLNNLGTLYFEQSRVSDAEARWREAIRLFEVSAREDKLSHATALVNLGELQRALSHYDDSERLHRSALALREELGGPDGLPVASSLNSLGALALERGRAAEAEELFRRALAIREKVQAPEDTLLGSTLHNLAESQRMQKRYDEARATFDEAIRLRTRLLGDSHPDVASTLANLGALYQDLQLYSEADKFGGRALEIRRRTLPPGHLQLAISLNNMGLVAMQLGNREKSRAYFDEAIAMVESSPVRERVLHALFLLNLGDWHRTGGDIAAADPLYRRAVGIFDNVAPEHPRAADALMGFARVFLEQGKVAGAEKLLLRALAIRQKTAQVDSAEVAALERILVQVYRAQHRETEAQRLERSFR